MRSSCRVVGSFVLLLAVGCSAKTAHTVPVSGKVTMDGAPLAKAFVTFTPMETTAGKPPQVCSGLTDEQGQYSLKVDSTQTPGAVPGAYRVRVEKMDRGGEGSPMRRQVVPPQYNRQSNLEYTVPAGGTSTANFDLPSNPAGQPGG
jgi:hypothetical protein